METNTATQKFDDRLDEIVAGAQGLPNNPETDKDDQPAGGAGDDNPDDVEGAEGGDTDSANQDAPDGEGDNNTPDEPTGEPNGEEDSTLDISARLEELSGGTIKSAEDLATITAKIKELEQKNQSLESEKETIFANDYVKLLNDLHKQGKTSEQIAEFQKLHSLGDLSTLDPKEILIQSLIDQGSARGVAEKLIERKYGLDQISLDEDALTDEELAKNKQDVELINEQIKLDAQAVRKDFQERIDSISKPVDPTQEALAKSAAEKAYREKLAPFAEKVSTDFPKEVAFGKVNFPVDDKFKDGIKEQAVAYFMDREVNNESVSEFNAVQKALFLAQNHEKISESLYEQGKTDMKAELEAKYVNNQGLERQGAVTNAKAEGISQDELAANAMDMAK